MEVTRKDGLLVAGLLAVSQTEVWGFGALGGNLAAAGLAAGGACVVAWRAHRPLTVACAECVLLLVAAQVSDATGVEPISATFITAFILAWFTLGRTSDRRRAAAGLALGLAYGGIATSPFRVDIYLAIVLTCFVVPWLLGSLMWMRREYADGLERAQSAEGATIARAAADPGVLKLLSTREAEVLELIVAGRSNAEIAAGLHVSLATVKTHVVSILRKLGVRDRTQAVVVALTHVTPPEN